ncbi:MAG: DUF4097 family beta strand repeat-containing protein [Candidatus Bathyarchaeia archaeon]|jgi:DUF4097 and DUF4098 domain-containing protein YvlB
MPYCRKCGAELAADANFCSKCGTPVAQAQAVPASQHQTFKVSGKPRLVVVNRSPGKVDVRPGADGEVTVDLQLREPDDVECSVSQSGSTVTVRCRALVHPFRWPRYFGSGGPRSDISVLVPKESEVHVEASLDQVTVDGIKGEVNVDTSIAKIYIANVEGKVHAKARTGQIEISNVNGTVTVENKTGPVTLENTNGTVSIQNRMGPIKFSGSLSTTENWFRTRMGSIELQLTGNPDLTVEAYTHLGSVTPSPDIADWHYERGRYVGRIGSGTGKLLIETRTGSVDIHR